MSYTGYMGVPCARDLLLPSGGNYACLAKHFVACAKAYFFSCITQLFTSACWVSVRVLLLISAIYESMVGFVAHRAGCVGLVLGVD